MKHAFAVTFMGSLLYSAAIAAIAQTPQGVTVEKDLVYGTGGGVNLTLDLARQASANDPLPLVICIHGGAWQLGSKSDFLAPIQLLASAGYVAAAVEYRFAPANPWPAQIEDVKCAVRYLRSRAQEFDIDPNRVAALGHSAGGHLALLLGLLDDAAFNDSGGNAGQSSKVQAVVNLAGPSDLATWRVLPQAEEEFQAFHGRDSDGILADLLGTSDRTAPVMAEASPVTHVSAGDPPILTIHGADDTIVSVEQARLLHAALDDSGLPHTLSIVDGAGHGFSPEQLMSVNQQTLAFLERTLRAPAGAEASSEP